MNPVRSLSGKTPFICRTCTQRFHNRFRRNFSTRTNNIYDVVCVGGGPAGLSLLTALRKLIVLNL